MIADALRDCSARGDLVLDGFGGSGSTLSRRRADWPPGTPGGDRAGLCRSTIRRWQDLGRDDAILPATGETFTARAATLSGARAGRGGRLMSGPTMTTGPTKSATASRQRQRGSERGSRAIRGVGRKARGLRSLLEEALAQSRSPRGADDADQQARGADPVADHEGAQRRHAGGCPDAAARWRCMTRNRSARRD